MSNVRFTNFGKTLLARGYFTIFTMILGLMYSLNPFIFLLFPGYTEIWFILPDISLVFTIIGMVLALVMLIYAKRVTTVDTHPQLRNFYSKTLIAFILGIIVMVYPVLQSLLLTLLSHNTISSIYIGVFIANAIYIVGVILNIFAWSSFLNYSNARRFNPNVTKGSNLIRIGYVLFIFSSILTILSSVWTYLYIISGYSFTPIMGILNYVIVYGRILFDIAIPILLIIGYVKVGNSIQYETLSSDAEPTLGDSPFDRAITQTTPVDRNICPNCGTSVLNSAGFCPYCGNSL